MSKYDFSYESKDSSPYVTVRVYFDTSVSSHIRCDVDSDDKMTAISYPHYKSDKINLLYRRNDNAMNPAYDDKSMGKMEPVAINEATLERLATVIISRAHQRPAMASKSTVPRYEQ